MKQKQALDKWNPLPGGFSKSYFFCTLFIVELFYHKLGPSLVVA